MTKAKKLDLLEHFYDHLNERDWLTGVDLYQSGRVLEVKLYDNLLVGRIDTPEEPFREVRLKMHPSRRVIQWMECTCKKNRGQGTYCEHLAAFMIHAEREQPDLFQNLDLKTPLRPPTNQRRSRAAKDSATSTSTSVVKTPEAGRNSASQTLLTHLQGSILHVGLAANSPFLKVKIELKPGTKSVYELDIDTSAAFMRNNRAIVDEHSSVQKLQNFEAKAEFGTAIYSTGDEKLAIERVIGLPCSQTLYNAIKEQLRAKHQFVKFTRYSGKDGDCQTDWVLLFPLKNCQRYTGHDNFFVSRSGYASLNRKTVTSEWNDIPLMSHAKDDAAANLVDSHFAKYLSMGTTWLHPELDNAQILDTFSLESIKVQKADDGWLYLDPRYGSGNSSVSMIELMHHYSQKKRRFLQRGNNWIKVPEFVTAYDWQLSETGDQLKVDTLGLLRLKAAVGEYDCFAGSKKILDEIRQRTDFTINTTTPDFSHTALNLREYQSEGVSWLWWLYQNNLHGLLADDMGLGKTHQAMAIMSCIQKEAADHAKPPPRFLVACPTTVLEHWENKINDFAPNLAPVRYHGPRRMEILRDRGDKYTTVITSYGVLLRDIAKLSAIDWEIVILDEAHFVKNSNTSTYRSACLLRSRMRLCLTGTPLENHLGELKNIFDFLVPGYLGSDDFFRKSFQNPIEQDRNLDQQVALQKLVYPLKLRRTKSQVLSDLPEKIEDVMRCTLSDEQAQMYRDVIEAKARPMVEQIGESNPVPYLHVFAILQLLKQICNHPALIQGRDTYREMKSGKFELMKELLREALRSGHKVVIFSQYIDMIKIIADYCQSEGVKAVTLTGQTQNRGAVIERFQTDDHTRVFIGSLLAGGIGIDLTAASVVIHYDRWWNASKENQATDRVHRIGQNRFVQVFKLITKGTLEEKIDEMIRRKHDVFSTFLEKDEEIFKSLTRQDLVELLDYS